MLESKNYSESSSIKMAERYQPDYETMITNLKKRLSRSFNFKNAALAYFEDQIASDKMAELIGELVTKCNMLERELASLIKRQEENQEK